MIFSRAEWGIWWTPSPRLVSAAILWFLYVVYLILRSSLPGSRQRRARICAVFAIIAFLDVPMVIISARFLPDVHRASFEFTSPWQYAAFFMSMIATVMLAGVLISLRTDLIKLNTTLEQQIS
jgi:heme exporter protein C